MEIEVIFIIACIVLAATAVYQFARASKLKKELGNQEFLVAVKDDIIKSLNSDKKLLKAQIDSLVAKRKDLDDQVSMLVTQINQTGVRRNAKGQFASVD